MKMKYLFLIAIFCKGYGFGQTADSLVSRSPVFQLGEVSVYGASIDTTNTISIKKIEKFNRTDISNALNVLPGITLANVGPRNESVIYIRGFDLRQVPVFIDGVPVYVPYDGYVDMGRFTTFDLSQINVSKGFASILYGANTMGGAINLVSKRPTEDLEVNARVGDFGGEGFRWNLNAGSNLGKYYFQLGLSQLKQTFFPLSNDYESKTFEDGDERENSYRDDFKFSAKAGFTPNATDEYVIGYSLQKGEKGNPPYVGDDTRINTRFWQRPEWNKESIFLVSHTALSEQSKLKARLFHDTFVNALFSFDDASYTAQTRPFAFQSYYDDFTLGGNAELETSLTSNNLLKFGVQYKHDVHRENNLGEPQRNFIDNTFSISMEHTYQIISELAVVPGLGFNTRKSVRAEDFDSSTQEITNFPSNGNSAINAQVGLFWDFATNNSLKGLVSRKTRFATIKDRYSYRMGMAIPNPDLTSEVALNYDLTYAGKINDKLRLHTSLFRSDISDIIQQVDNVQPDRFQLQNAGNALFQGFEISTDYKIAKRFMAGANYTFIERKNRTDPDILFTNVPKHKVFGYVDYTFPDRANILLSTEYNSDRFSTSYGTVAKAYNLVNAKTTVFIKRGIELEAGINNLFDKNYSLIEGFPEAGKNYFVNLVYRYK